MNRPINVLIHMIQHEILNSKAVSSCPEPLSRELLSELFTLAKKHDLAGLAGHALQDQNLLETNPICTLFQQEIFNSIYRHEKMNFAYQMICDALENAQIAFLPLKGAYMRQYYPQPWMRTSCDIDILVHKNKIHLAEQILASELGFCKTSESAYDISLFSQDGIHIELHHDLMEHNRAGQSSLVLERVWEHSFPIKAGSYQYKMDDTMFYFYHIAHMAKHFESGGCGIRQFLDLWFLMNHMNTGSSKIEKLLKDSGLLAFEEAVRYLCQVWFSGKEHNIHSLQLESFVLDSGTYGTREHLYLENQRNHGGKVRYLFSRIFLPYEKLKYRYPSVKKWPILTPVYEIYRLCQFLFGRKRTLLLEYVGVIKNDFAIKAESTASILDFVGL